MKPIAKGALWAAVLAIAACIALPIGFVALKWFTEPPCPLSEPLPGVDDFSRLGRNQVSRVVAVRGGTGAAERQICELVRWAAGNGEHIAIVGARHSMGGHTLYPGGIALNMTGFNRLRLNSDRTLLTAGAGARWSEVIPFLDRAGRSIAIMQSNNDFTVGGSVSVNCHGWQYGAPPIASSVESFRLVDSEGRILRCSRDENPRLFALALGGYGLFGAILEVTLRLVPNEEYRASTHRTRPEEYAADYGRLTQGKNEIGLVYGRISVAPGSFLSEARELIDAALDCRGTYYLPYRPHATPAQFSRSYPQARGFFAEKRRLDPGEVFSNQFYLNYGQPESATLASE